MVAGQLQDVGLTAGAGQEEGEVVEPLAVAEDPGALADGHRPPVRLPTQRCRLDIYPAGGLDGVLPGCLLVAGDGEAVDDRGIDGGHHDADW